VWYTWLPYVCVLSEEGVRTGLLEYGPFFAEVVMPRRDYTASTLTVVRHWDVPPHIIERCNQWSGMSDEEKARALDLACRDIETCAQRGQLALRTKS
jgi:hypothetical protein